MKKTLIVLGFSIITVLLVACSSPSKQYKNTIDDLSILEDVENIDTQWNEIAQLMDMLDTVEISSEEQTIEELYQKLTVYDQLIEHVLRECENIETSDTQVLTNHNKLIDTINIYREMSLKARSVLLVKKDFMDLSISVEEIYNQLIDITLSGTPTTDKYKNQLNNFVVNNQLYLKLFDLQTAQDLLIAEHIEVDFIAKQLDESELIFNKIQKLTRYSDEDEEVNRLLIIMYGEIYKMYEIVLENAPLIESSNAFETFEEFTSEDLQQVKTYYSEWLLFLDEIEE